MSVLRAYVAAPAAGLMPPATPGCNCLGDPVVKGSSRDSTLVGWLHAADCGITEELLQREAEAGVA